MRSKIPGSIRTSLPAALSLVLALSLALALSATATQASTSNDVNLDFNTTFSHNAEGEEVGNTALSVDAVYSHFGVGNQPNDPPEEVASPVLTFTADESVTVESWDQRDWREGSEYIWDLPTIGDGEGLDRGVGVNLASPETFVPGFDVSRTLSQPGPDTLVLEITSTLIEDFDGFSVFVQIPDSFPNVTVVDAGGDGDHFDISEDGKFATISIEAPDQATYTFDFTIQVLGGGDAIAYVPFGMAAEGLNQGTQGVESATSVTKASGQGEWTIETLEAYSWHWTQSTAKRISWAMSGNRVDAIFETGRTYSTGEDRVDNALLEGGTWVGAGLHNLEDGTGAEIADPILRLDTDEMVGGVSEPGYFDPDSGLYTWEFDAISEGDGRNGHAGLEGSVEFEPGFSVEREVDLVTFPATGGSQTLTLSVTPEEPMESLEVSGQVQMSEQEVAHVVDVQYVFGPTEGPGGDFGPEGFWMGIENPDPSETYVWQVTIEILPRDTTADLDFVPSVQVRNVQITDYHVGDDVLGDSLSRELSSGLGTWTWSTAGDCFWEWDERTVKAVDLQGYASSIGEKEVRVVFDRGQSYTTDGDFVDGTSIVQSDNTSAFTFFGYVSGGPVVQPVLTLDTAEAVAVSEQFLVSDTNPYRWEFPDSEGTGGVNGPTAGADFTTYPEFTPGLTVAREVNSTSFPATGGTQVLTLSVTVPDDVPPDEVVDLLRVGCYTEVAPDLAHITNVEYSGPEVERGEDLGTDSVWEDVGSPPPGTYVWQITLDILPQDGATEIAFMPRVTVVNHHVVAEEEAYGTGISRTQSCDYGTWTWTWQATGDYLWGYTDRAIKSINLAGYADISSGMNSIQVNFMTGKKFHTDEDSVSNVLLDGYLAAYTDIQNPEDMSGSPIVGPGGEGGPRLDLEASSDISWAQEEFLAAGEVPGREFTWEFPAVPENEGRTTGVHLGDVSFTPGFSATRSADETVFDSDGGVQTLTVSVTPEEDIQHLAVGGQVHLESEVGFTAELISVEWLGAPPDSHVEQHGSEGFGAGINNAVAGTTYTLEVKTQVATDIDGVVVTYMPFIEVVNEGFVTHEEGTLDTTLSHDTVTGAWIWTVGDGPYVYSLDEGASRVVEFDGYARSNANMVHALCSASQVYATQQNSVQNITLVGYAALGSFVINQPDGHGAVTGGSDEGGPFVSLSSSSTAIAGREDHLISGTWPGTEFTWGLPAIGEGVPPEQCWADLDEPVYFTPGFSVSRTADVTSFGSEGGTQHMLLTIIPEEAIAGLNLFGDVGVVGGGYSASIQSVEWVGDPPEHYNLNYDADRFQCPISNLEEGVTLTLEVTMQVASTVPDADVEFMPNLSIRNARTLASSDTPVIGNTLTRTAGAGTWTWTAEGTYLWTWAEAAARIVDLKGHANHAPVVETIVAEPQLVALGDAVALTGSFIDADEEGDHTATWQWDRDDPETEPGTVTYLDSTGQVTGVHTYEEPGVYEVILTVTDPDGAEGVLSYQYIVVYDPEGGFVTGGGWIDSPTGSYAPDPTLVGKATFGFVSKYKKGASVPTGSTEFQFKVADLTFKSTSYDWLVVAGAKAKYKGTGTINGEGTYAFMLSAVDAALTPSTSVDLFRIKIWDKTTGVVVYDNQMGAADDADAATAIEGGSIVIHK